jgi:hypothetical protein
LTRSKGQWKVRVHNNYINGLIIEKSDYNFLHFVRRNFGDDLADMLESKNMLAFDLGDEDDEYFLSRHQSVNRSEQDKREDSD